MLYLLYTAELEQLILRYGLHIHQDADDSQVYISVPVGDVRIAAPTTLQSATTKSTTASEPDQRGVAV